ncbi:MAG: type II toxin-antitoxin system HicA family toxin [Planctomycetaceae bacterium]
MPRKIRELIADLLANGFADIAGDKGSHRKFVHDRYRGALTLSGQSGDDAKPYQENRSGKRWRPFMKTTDAYHKWVEWSDEDGAYIGKCPDLISGIHGDDPVRVYADLARVIEEVVAHFEQSGRQLPPPRVRPMQDVV